MSLNLTEKNTIETGEPKRIYFSESGDVRLETRNARRIFTPEEFVRLLRDILDERKRKHALIIDREILSKICGFLLIFSSLMFFGGCAEPSESAGISKETNSANPFDQTRIVTVGGAVTEMAYALGAGDLIVATDTSSLYPEEATNLPQIGYQRRLSAEGVVAQKPTHVIAASEAGPPPALKQIEAAGIKISIIENDPSVEGAKRRIRRIAEILDSREKGERLIEKMDGELAEARRCAASIEKKPKILFIYARGGGTANVSGMKTEAAAMIELAGGENALKEFEGYKPLTAEALVAAAPDIILMPKKGLESIGGENGLLKLAGMPETPAGKNRRFVAVEDLLLLGFSPRLGQAVRELCEKIK